MESSLSDTTTMAILLKPLIVLIVMAGIVYPLTLLVSRAMPDGKVKDFLFKKRGD
jgi:hypothetical protein